MSVAEVKTRITPEELLTLPDGDPYELVDGQLVERQMGTLSSWVATRISHILTAWADAQHAGWVIGSDGSYQCFPNDPNKVRKPDVSFIRRGRLPGEELPSGHTRIHPDLAVEVISPNDLYSEVDIKVEEYLAANVPLVWVVNPEHQTAKTHSWNGGVRSLSRNHELSDDDALPGFRCRVAEIFRSPVE